MCSRLVVRTDAIACITLSGQAGDLPRSSRHARRMIQQDCDADFWTPDKTTKRIYLTGQVKVAVKLVKNALDAGFHHLVETNKPGKRRVRVDLSRYKGLNNMLKG